MHGKRTILAFYSAFRGRIRPRWPNVQPQSERRVLYDALDELVALRISLTTQQQDREAMIREVECAIRLVRAGLSWKRRSTGRAVTRQDIDAAPRAAP